MKLKSDLRRYIEFCAAVAGVIVGVVIACGVFLVILAEVLRTCLDK